MTEPAPWERNIGGRKSTSGIRGPADTFKLPPEAKIPDVYKPEGSSFIAPSGRTVSRPPMPPRSVEKLAQLALLAMVGAVVLGLLGVVFSFGVLDPQAGSIRYIYAAMAGVVLGIGAVGLILELPRMAKYRTGEFMPGVLMYGSKAQMEKVAGPLGISTILAQRARGTGAGILNLVFDRSAHIASAPEVVAIHCNRGNGPELLGIEWEAVRELQRGDVVWFRILSSTNFLMFHKFIPYAPRIVIDRATREEIFTALRVGSNVYRERAASQNTGEAKPIVTDSSGHAVVVGSRKVGSQQKAPESKIPLKAQGAQLGSADQPEQDQTIDRNRPAQDTEKIAKPWAPDDA
jgi:hypothetical protein